MPEHHPQGSGTVLLCSPWNSSVIARFVHSMLAAVDIYDSSEIYIMFFFSHFSMSFPQYIYIFSTMQLTHSMAQLTYEQYMRRANIEQLQKLSQSVQSRPISDSPRGDVVCHNSVIHPSLISLVSYAKRPVNLRVSAPIPCYKARG